MGTDFKNDFLKKITESKKILDARSKADRFFFWFMIIWVVSLLIGFAVFIFFIDKTR